MFEGEYYDAYVTKIHANGTYDVDFEGTKKGANDTKVKKRVGEKKNLKKSTPTKQSPTANPKKGMSLSKQFLQVESEASPKRGGRAPVSTPTKTRITPAKTRQSPTSVAKTASPKGKQLSTAAKTAASKVSAKSTPQKESPRQASSKKSKSDRVFKVGDTVEALWDADGFYYDAEVEKVHNSKYGVTYDLRFVQDNILEKGRKPTQIQGLRNAGQSSSDGSDDEESQSRSSGSRKKRKEDDTDYTGAGGVDFAEDYIVNEDSERGNQRGGYDDSDDDDDSRDNRRSSKNPSNKRKRVASAKPQQPNKVPKRRRDEMIDNLTRLKKDEIVDLVYDIIEKKSVITIGDLEKGIAAKRTTKK
jgi:hypothetical protein